VNPETGVVQQHTPRLGASTAAPSTVTGDGSARDHTPDFISADGYTHGMEIPSLVQERLGEESIETAVSLGSEDVVCFTPSRTLLYRGEGLLSDEGVDVFAHDVERLDVSEGRRKTEFVFEYVDGKESFTVPSDRTGDVLEQVLAGVLGAAGVTDPDEAVVGVFRFSELTLVVTDSRLVKHIGAHVWDADYEEFPYDAVTGLAFEEGSVATQVVLSTGGHPERIKAPSDQAPRLRETLERALFSYHGVDSLAALNEALGEDDDERGQDSGDGGGLAMNEGISPLVGDDADDSSRRTGGQSGGASGAGGDEARAGDRSGGVTDTGRSPGGTDRRDTESESSTRPGSADAGGSTTHPEGGQPRPAATGGVDPEEFEELREQVELLAEAVQRQNEVLEGHTETVDQLIEELRQGR